MTPNGASSVITALIIQQVLLAPCHNLVVTHNNLFSHQRDIAIIQCFNLLLILFKILKYLFIVFLSYPPNNYGKIIRFLKLSGFNAMPTALVCLNVVHTGHYEWSPVSRSVRSFWWVACHDNIKVLKILILWWPIKGWFARVEPMGVSLIFSVLSLGLCSLEPMSLWV